MISSNINKYELLGVTVTPASVEKLNEIIYYHISAKQKCIIGHQNLHSIYLYHRSEKMKYFYDCADYIYIDGMPIVWLAKCLGYPVKISHRVTFVDWIHPFLELATENEWRIFYLGAKPEVVQKGIQKLKEKYPGLLMEGVHGYFDPTPAGLDNTEIIELINSYQPHILMVGMGMPRQESWVVDNYEEIDSWVIVTCGGCLDYFAGVNPIPPRWLGRMGLEWLFRLFSEPRRLWRRYLIEPWVIIDLLRKDLRRNKQDRSSETGE